MPDAIEFKLAESVAVLTGTPEVLNVLFGDLPPIWVHGTEGQGTWSAFDIVGYLVAGERTDWLPRVKILLEH